MARVGVRVKSGSLLGRIQDGYPNLALTLNRSHDPFGSQKLTRVPVADHFEEYGERENRFDTAGI